MTEQSRDDKQHSFFKDNPFINILGKRGKEPDQTYREPNKATKANSHPSKAPKPDTQTKQSERSKRKKKARTRPAPQSIKSKGWGGARAGSGHPQRKPLPWPSQFDMKDREGMMGLFRHFIEMLWTGKMDARLGGCLNNSFRLYAEMEGWIVKTPLQIMQAQQVGGRSEAEIVGYFEWDKGCGAEERSCRIHQQPGKTSRGSCRNRLIRSSDWRSTPGSIPILTRRSF